MMASVLIPPHSAGNRSAGQPPSKLTDATLVLKSVYVVSTEPKISSFYG
jgi:hypothetical protein